MKNRFDEAALTWDENPDNFNRSKAIAGAISSSISFRDSMSGMELGCGTGILGFFFQEKLSELFMVDESKEMLRITDEKIKSGGFDNMKTLRTNLLHDPYPHKHDLIISQMTFHHIHDTSLLLSTLYDVLNPGGYLCVADLVKEDGTFHSHVPDFDGHFGFDLDEFKNLLVEKGFQILNSSICYTITKKEPVAQKEFPIFLLIAQK
ncbi:MAG: methyltransferase domain-containing protein [Leptospiraceae bacterium]|nr:methyltransferase domain-containing protein [Leptospiraceae bacterium]